MARLIYALNQSLDGYVDHIAFAPDPALFRHFIEDVRGLTGAIYGRRMYETMRYWDDDHDDWDDERREYATVWQQMPKWVVSRSLTSAGPNAVLIRQDVEAQIAALKAELDGDIEIAGPELVASLTASRLIDEFRLYVHPVVLGEGKPFFIGPRPALRLVAHERIGENSIRLTYVPA